MLIFLDVNRQFFDKRIWRLIVQFWFSSTSNNYLSTNSKTGAKLVLSLLIFKGLQNKQHAPYRLTQQSQNFIALG